MFNLLLLTIVAEDSSFLQYNSVTLGNLVFWRTVVPSTSTARTTIFTSSVEKCLHRDTVHYPRTLQSSHETFGKIWKKNLHLISTVYQDRIFKHLNYVKVSAKNNPVLIQVKEAQQQLSNLGL